MDVKTEGVSTNSLIALHTEGYSKTICSTEKVSSGGQTVKYIEEIGKKTRCMASENLIGLMVGNTRVTSRMMSNMERADSFGHRLKNQSKGHTMVTGLMGNNTDLVCIQTIKIKQGGESGRVVSFNAGLIRITTGYQSKILYPTI
jgi:hypothetical protein